MKVIFKLWLPEQNLCKIELTSCIGEGLMRPVIVRMKMASMSSCLNVWYPVGGAGH